MSDRSILTPARLLTAFGTVLYVDPVSGELRHGAVADSPANLVVLPHTSTPLPACRLMKTEGNAFVPLVCGTERRLFSAQNPQTSATPPVIELKPLERGLLALWSEGGFLTAHPDGHVSLTGPACSTWELFLASEDWCGAIDSIDSRETFSSQIDRKRIEGYIVHPTSRARINTNSRRRKILIYGYTQWSHGRVYYDLCKHLHRRGYVVDILDWRVNHAGYIGEILPYYDLCMTALDGVRTLVDSYGIPYEKIIALSHHELDMRMLIEQKGIDSFEKFANFGVVSEFVYCASQILGVPRVPMVAPLGVNFSEFYMAIPKRLETVGYASSMSTKTYGVEWKRGELAEAAAREAGLSFKIAGSTASQISFHEMPEFYRSVDAVLTTSLSESGPLTVTEAAAAGRLVIGTPVGHFPGRAYQGGGILAPVEAEKFKTFVAETLRYYRENPNAFVDKCRRIQESARQYDWQYMIDPWIELIESAREVEPKARARPISDSTHSKLMRTLWRAEDPYGDPPRASGAADLQGWNSNHSFLLNSIATHRPTLVVEVGVWKGASTIAMAKKMRDCGIDGAVIAIDTWLGAWDHWNDDRWFADLSFKSGYPQLFYKFVQNVVAEQVQDFVIPLPLDSSNAYHVLNRKGIIPDMIHIDGAHDYDSVLGDMKHWWSLLRPGGVLVADDYYDTGMWPEVRRAVDEFLSSVPHLEFEFREGKCRVTKA